MFELIYDVQLGAWISIDLAAQGLQKKISEFVAKRRGYFPYSYNFVLGRRGDTAQCSYCGKFILMKEMTRDHVWPKSLGGEITTTACYDCNTKKKDMKPIEWGLWLDNRVRH